MSAKTKFKSPAFEPIHSAASGLFSVDAIPQETMRSFDTACLSSIKDLQPLEIKALREKLNVSQPVFARYLNTSVSTVQKWESGAKRPSGMSLKLLNVVQKHGLKVLVWGFYRWSVKAIHTIMSAGSLYNFLRCLTGIALYWLTKAISKCRF